MYLKDVANIHMIELFNCNCIYICAHSISDSVKEKNFSNTLTRTAVAHNYPNRSRGNVLGPRNKWG